MTATITHEGVPVGVLPIIRAKVAAAARKCERWGIDAPVLTIGASYTVPDMGDAGPGYRPEDLPLIEVADLTLMAPERIGIPGWSLLARIDILPDGAWLAIRTPGTEAISLPDIADPTACDHCHSRRHRKDTFLVLDPSGAIKQVGRNCLADHLGYDPERMLYWASFTSDLDEFMGELPGHDPERLLPTQWLLWTASRIAAHGGFMGISKARDINEEHEGRQPVISTAAHVRHRDALLRDARHGNSTAILDLARWDERFPEDDAASRLYNATLSALSEGSGSGEWFDNVSAICAQEAVRPRHEGIAVSAVVLGLKAIDAPREEREDITSVPLGAVGERLDLTGEVTFTRQFDSGWGVRTLIKIRVDESDVTWWATGDRDIEVGSTISLRATVKAHEEDRYTKRLTTVITRAKES